MKKIFIKILIANLGLWGSPMEATFKIICFDNDGVLTKRDNLGLIKEIGLSYPLMYSLCNLKSPNIRSQCFKVLESLGGPQIPPPNEPLAENEGLIIPQILCDWMIDKYRSQEIKNMLETRIETLAQKKYFTHAYEKEYVYRLLLAVLTPETLARHTWPIPQALSLLNTLATQKDEYGNPKFLQTVFSNSASEAFEKVYNSSQCKPLFRYMDSNNFFISGAMHDLKPYSSIYKQVINTLKEKNIIDNPQEILFIDDEAINVKAAQNEGITALYLANGDYEQLEEKLEELNILPRRSLDEKWKIF
jgi:FMN phosphatase YigB (HAD superfamily)